MLSVVSLKYLFEWKVARSVVSYKILLISDYLFSCLSAFPPRLTFLNRHSRRKIWDGCDKFTAREGHRSLVYLYRLLRVDTNVRRHRKNILSRQCKHKSSTQEFEFPYLSPFWKISGHRNEILSILNDHNDRSRYA